MGKRRPVAGFAVPLFADDFLRSQSGQTTVHHHQIERTAGTGDERERVVRVQTIHALQRLMPAARNRPHQQQPTHRVIIHNQHTQRLRGRIGRLRLRFCNSRCGGNCNGRSLHTFQQNGVNGGDDVSGQHRFD